MAQGSDQPQYKRTGNRYTWADSLVNNAASPDGFDIATCRDILLQLRVLHKDPDTVRTDAADSSKEPPNDVKVEQTLKDLEEAVKRYEDFIENHDKKS